METVKKETAIAMQKNKLGEIKMTKKNGSYRNLKLQMDKITRHTNQGSIQTRRRYEHSFDRFCKFLGESKVQNIKNIQDKHIHNYVEELQKREVSPAYIKTELSGIRFYFDRIDNPRLKELPSNDDLKLENRSYRGIDRKWTDEEFSKFKITCDLEDKSWIGQAADIGRYAGFRIHEVTRLDRDDLEQALENDYFTIKGKGGRVREVPLKDELRGTVETLWAETEPHSKVFVDEGNKTHNVIKEIQNFVRDNRDEYMDSEATRGSVLTFHGLRHSYASEEYENAIKDGYEVEDAEKRISNLLGHNRPEVTRIYLAK